MRPEELKQSVETVEMSEEMQARIIRACRRAAEEHKEETTMKKKTGFRFGRTAAAAAVVLCLCISVAAAGQLGGFRDVVNAFGAVVGTTYAAEAGEIAVSAEVTGDMLAVTAVLANPDAAPYRECEHLGIGAYRIVDAEGKTVAEGVGEDFAAIVDGEVSLSLPLPKLAAGEYQLLVSAFVGEKKADQPLPITGSWVCGFAG